MVGHHMAFLYPAFLLQRKLMENFSYIFSQLPIQTFLPALGYKHHMVFALPLGMI